MVIFRILLRDRRKEYKNLERERIHNWTIYWRFGNIGHNRPEKARENLFSLIRGRED